MHKAKPVCTPLVKPCKLSAKQSPISEKEKAEMNNVPYAFTVGSQMYAMICTRLNIAYDVSVLSQFLSIQGNEH